MECNLTCTAADSLADLPPIITMTDASRRLGRDHRTIRKHADAIGVPFRRIGNYLALEPVDFERLRRHFAREGDRETTAAR